MKKDESPLTNVFSFEKPPKVIKPAIYSANTYWNSTIKRKPPKKKLKKPKEIKFPKEKTFSELVKELDGMVSKYILEKGNYTCVRCGKQYLPNQKGLTCSHYWDRQYKGTRWKVENLDPLCWLPCHSQKWEHDKQGVYKDYMMKKLGKKKFNQLEIMARSITKYSRIDLEIIIDNFHLLYK